MSRWDYFVGSLLRWIYETQPEIIEGISHSLTFSELKKFDIVDEARAYLIEQEASDVLRQSRIDQIEYIEKKLRLRCETVSLSGRLLLN